MKISKEITSYLNNIKYYTGKIDELARKQLDEDCELAEVNVPVATRRFNALGRIGSACSWLAIYCENIGSNLKIASETDSELGIVEEEEDIEEGRRLF